MALFTQIDPLTRPDHWHLTEEDRCFFLREYYAGKGYKHSETNSLIFNLKKSPLRKGTPEWPHKLRAIQRVGMEMRGAIHPKWLEGACIVPIPPSKAKTDPEYDDRMVQVARIICDGTAADLRELLLRRSSGQALHAQSKKRDVEKLYTAFSVDEQVATPTPTRFGLIDDVLTTGATFRAASRRLNERFPSALIAGFFVARRVPTDDDGDDFVAGLVPTIRPYPRR